MQVGRAEGFSFFGFGHENLGVPPICGRHKDVGSFHGVCQQSSYNDMKQCCVTKVCLVTTACCGGQRVASRKFGWSLGRFRE